MKTEFTCLLISALLGGNLCAQEPSTPAPLSLRAALAAAIKRNPVLLSGTDRITGAQGLRVQAGLKPNPRIVFQSENARAWGSQGTRAVSQTERGGLIR